MEGKGVEGSNRKRRGVVKERRGALAHVNEEEEENGSSARLFRLLGPQL